MKTAVVLCAYNGEKYIEKQLESLLNQTRKIDKVLIIDDFSQDKTVEIVKMFVEKHEIQNWKIKENDSNKGWKVNFYEGIKAVDGDIIFPCDQDDIWHNTKIELMTNIMEKNQNIMVLEGQAHKFFEVEKIQGKNENIRTLIGTWLDMRKENRNVSLNSGKVNMKEFNNSFMKRAPGCTLAVRKKFFETIESEWFPQMPHDALITYYANIQKRYYCFDQEVIEWRQHVGSASRPTERNKQKRIEEIALDREMIGALIKYSKRNHMGDDITNILVKACEWNGLRMELVNRKKIINALKLLKYISFYLQRRRYFTDLKYGMELK